MASPIRVIEKPEFSAPETREEHQAPLEDHSKQPGAKRRRTTSMSWSSSGVGEHPAISQASEAASKSQQTSSVFQAAVQQLEAEGSLEHIVKSPKLPVKTFLEVFKDARSGSRVVQIREIHSSAYKILARLPTGQDFLFNFELEVLQLSGKWFQNFSTFNASVSDQLRFHRLAEVERLELNVSRWAEAYFEFLLTKSVDILQRLDTVKLYYDDGQVPNVLRTWQDFCAKFLSSHKKKWEMDSLTNTRNGKPRVLPTANFQRSPLPYGTDKASGPILIENLDITSAQLLVAVPWGGIPLPLLRAKLGLLNYSPKAQGQLESLMRQELYESYDMGNSESLSISNGPLTRAEGTGTVVLKRDIEWEKEQEEAGPA